MNTQKKMIHDQVKLHRLMKKRMNSFSMKMKGFPRENIECHCLAMCSPRVLARNPPSPFIMHNEVVIEKFESLLQNFLGKEDDVAYL